MFCCAQPVDNGVAGWVWDGVCPGVGRCTSPSGALIKLRSLVVDRVSIEIFGSLRMVRGLFVLVVQELLCLMKKGR